MSIEAAAVTVATTATALNAAEGAQSDRVSLLVSNVGSATVYLGPSGVTTSSGVPLAAGASVSINDLDPAVAASFVGNLTFPTPLSWSAGSGPFAGLQFVQFPLTRVGDDGVNDTLAEDLGVLAVILTPGS